MKLIDETDTDSLDHRMSPDQELIKEEDDWDNEHGHPSYEYLQSLVADRSLESLEKLHAIAIDLDVNFDTNTSAEMLAELIYSSIEDDDDLRTTP